ncbi:hypothetical protein HK405_011973 [Cladochytrium tenue]|nr:hypothetical protein HK405_011973 [Cladochytrium tenue]
MASEPISFGSHDADAVAAFTRRAALLASLGCHPTATASTAALSSSHYSEPPLILPSIPLPPAFLHALGRLAHHPVVTPPAASAMLIVSAPLAVPAPFPNAEAMAASHAAPPFPVCRLSGAAAAATIDPNQVPVPAPGPPVSRRGRHHSSRINTRLHPYGGSRHPGAGSMGLGASASLDYSKAYRQLVNLTVRIIYQLTAPFGLFHAHAAVPVYGRSGTTTVDSAAVISPATSSPRPTVISSLPAVVASPAGRPPTHYSPPAAQLATPPPSPLDPHKSHMDDCPVASPAPRPQSSDPAPTAAEAARTVLRLQLQSLLEHDRPVLSRIKALTAFMISLPQRHLLATSAPNVSSSSSSTRRRHVSSAAVAACPAPPPSQAHHVFFALLYVSRMVRAAILARRPLPAELASPSALFLAGCMLAEAHLCDAQTSTATWARVVAGSGATPASAGVSPASAAAAVKRAALLLIGYDTHVRVEDYLDWLYRVRCFSA